MGTATADPAADEIRRAQEKGAAAKERAAAANGNGNGGSPALPTAADDDGVDTGGELVIEGSGQLSMSVGGKRATTSSLRLTGGKIDVEGSFEKGEIVVLRLEAVVGEIAFIDQTDPKTRQVVGCDRRHKARVVALTVDESHK